MLSILFFINTVKILSRKFKDSSILFITADLGPPGGLNLREDLTGGIEGMAPSMGE